jgi:hypothetical protein
MQYSYLSALCTSKRVDARVRTQTFGLLYMGKYELVYRALHRNRKFDSCQRVYSCIFHNCSW